MSETNYEAPLEPAVDAEQSWDPEGEADINDMAGYLGDPLDDGYDARVFELEKAEQLDRVRAAVDERLQPFAEFLLGIGEQAAYKEGEEAAARIIGDVAKEHGAELDPKKVLAEADAELAANGERWVHDLVQRGNDPATAHQTVYGPDGARATLEWVARRSIPTKGDEMGVLGRWMGQNVAGGRVPKDFHGESLPAGDEMNVTRKYFPQG
jgi:hypothetical protein